MAQRAEAGGVSGGIRAHSQSPDDALPLPPPPRRVHIVEDCAPTRASRPDTVARRRRTLSGSKTEDHLMTTDTGKRIYTKGRPPWYDLKGRKLKDPFVIGIGGGSASGKTTVADSITKRIEMPWVTLLSLDSFYKVLNEEQHALAAENKYNFDHPDAFDFGLLVETLNRLRDGRCVEVPVYNFSTHRREKHWKPMYGADVIIFEGILAFYNADVAAMMDLKLFVDTDDDTRLLRRLRRDCTERARDVSGVLQQYMATVKPAFDSFIAPQMKTADLIVPRGGENNVAIDLIVKQVKRRLVERGYDAQSQRAQMAAGGRLNGVCSNGDDVKLPESLHVIRQTAQILGMHTFIRDRQTPPDEFIFYSTRLMRSLLEHALSLLPSEAASVRTPAGDEFAGRRSASSRGGVCAVSIMRAGQTFEQPVREVVKDCKLGRILIQTNEQSREPEMHYVRLPKDMADERVLLLDATVATGAAAMMAIRILLDHDVAEQNITLVSLLMAEAGVHSVAYAFPRVTLATTAVDAHLSHDYWILPGLGNFGDRFYGTEPLDCAPTDTDDDSE